MKNDEFHHFWEISATCTGTGAEQVRYSPPEPNLYWYKCGKGAVQPSKTEPVPVQVWNRCGTALQNRTYTGIGAEQVRYSPPKPNLYRYRCGTGAVQPPEPNLYRYRSELYRYR